MGRLDDIVDRNKNPRKHRRAMFPISIGLSLFVLFIIISMVCTDLGDPPKKAEPAADGDRAAREGPGSRHRASRRATRTAAARQRQRDRGQRAPAAAAD